MSRRSRIAFAFEPLGDHGALIRLTGAPIELLSLRAQAIASAIQSRHVTAISDIVPAYSSVAIYFDPLQISFATIEKTVRGLLSNATTVPAPPPVVVEIPVCYGGAFGPDLEYVASEHGLSGENVIELHHNALYTVAMIGFTPGFPYLLGLPDTLTTPRRSVPRTAVAEGSVAIGGSQTGIYSLQTPGGWHIIGRTPLRLFDPSKSSPSLLAAGDTVRFIPIDSAAFANAVSVEYV